MSLFQTNQFASSQNLLAQDVDALVSANTTAMRPCECERGGGQRAVRTCCVTSKHSWHGSGPHGRGSYAAQPECLRLSRLPVLTAPSTRRMPAGGMQAMRPSIWARLILATARA